MSNTVEVVSTWLTTATSDSSCIASPGCRANGELSVTDVSVGPIALTSATGAIPATSSQYNRDSVPAVTPRVFVRSLKPIPTTSISPPPHANNPNVGCEGTSVSPAPAPPPSIFHVVNGYSSYAHSTSCTLAARPEI